MKRTSVQGLLDSELRHNHRMSEAPTAWQDMMNTFETTDGKTTSELNTASKELGRQLGNPEIRRRLRGLIPCIVNGIVVDLMNQSYAVIDLSGQRGAWRDLSAYVAASHDGWSHRRDKKGDAHRFNVQNGSFKARTRKGARHRGQVKSSTL